MARKESKKARKASATKEESPQRFNTLVVNGDKYRTLYTEKFKNRKKWVKPDQRKIYSDIPGTVLKLFVKEGQKVKEGDVMMILETMKMKNKIIFPIDGTVKKIYVSEEERIPKGHLMIELK